MRRTWFVIGATAALLLTLVLPAQAKGEVGDVTISNSSGGGGAVPGGSGKGGAGGGGSGGSGAALAVPVHLEGEHAYLWMDTIFASRVSAPRGELGAAFDVVATLDCGKSTSLINQRFYPYAEGGAVAYVPNGQRACGGPVDTGWSIVDAYVMTAVTEAGLPEPKAPAPAKDPIPPAEDAAAGSGSKAVGDTEPLPAPAAPAAETTSFPMLPVIVGLAALLAMLTGAAVVHRRRSSIVA